MVLVLRVAFEEMLDSELGRPLGGLVWVRLF